MSPIVWIATPCVDTVAIPNRRMAPTAMSRRPAPILMGPTSLSEFWLATPSSPRLWPQTDALPGDRRPARSDGSDRVEDCAGSATVCAAPPGALGRYLISDRRGVRGHAGQCTNRRRCGFRLHLP